MSGTKFLTYDIPWHIFWHSISDEGERQNETTGEKLMRRRCIGQQNNKVDTHPNAYPNFRYTILHGSAWCKSKFFRWSGTMTKKNTLHSCSWGLFGIFPEFGQFYGAGDALFGSVCGGPMPPAQTNFHNLLSTNVDKRWQCMTSTRQTDETRKHVTDAAW